MVIYYYFHALSWEIHLTSSHWTSKRTLIVICGCPEAEHFNTFWSLLVLAFDHGMALGAPRLSYTPVASRLQIARSLKQTTTACQASALPTC